MQSRNYGIDLLRIVSMLMVTLLHVLGHGGVLESTVGISHKMVWFFETAAFCSANCYALISGYVGVNSKHKYANIAILYLQVIFYTLLIAFGYALYKPEIISEGVFFRSLFPFVYNHYWYFTAYFCLFFFMPFINKMLIALSRKEIKILAGSIIVLFTVIPTAFMNDPFNLNGGYSAIWITALYVFGGCIQILDFSNLRKRTLLGVYAICVMLSWLNKFYIPCPEKGALISYLSPTILVAAASLVILFSKISPGRYFQMVITFFAPLSFGVFLIHTHPLIWNEWLTDRYLHFAEYSVFGVAGASIIAAVAIWFVCSLIDYVRYSLFRLLKIKKGFVLLEQKMAEKK